jgi:hypothetical protein
MPKQRFTSQTQRTINLIPNRSEKIMPVEIFDEKEFLEIAKSRADLCRIKKSKDTVKLKLRTPKHLFTFKTTPANAEELLKQIEIEQIEL